jgi:hypothetical protein
VLYVHIHVLEHYWICVLSEVFPVMMIHILVFWIMMLYSLVGGLPAFWGRYFLFKTTQLHNLEDYNVNQWMFFRVSQESFEYVHMQYSIMGLIVSTGVTSMNCYINLITVLYIICLHCDPGISIHVCERKRVWGWKSVNWIWSSYGSSDIMLQSIEII